MGCNNTKQPRLQGVSQWKIEQKKRLKERSFEDNKQDVNVSSMNGALPYQNQPVDLPSVPNQALPLVLPTVPFANVVDKNRHTPMMIALNEPPSYNPLQQKSINNESVKNNNNNDDRNVSNGIIGEELKEKEVVIEKYPSLYLSTYPNPDMGGCRVGPPPPPMVTSLPIHWGGIYDGLLDVDVTMMKKCSSKVAILPLSTMQVSENLSVLFNLSVDDGSANGDKKGIHNESRRLVQLLLLRSVFKMAGVTWCNF